MIFVKGVLAGAAALGVTAAVIFGLAVGVPRILELLPPTNEGGAGVWAFGPFSKSWLIAAALLIFGGGFYWNFRRSLPNRTPSQHGSFRETARRHVSKEKAPQKHDKDK